MAYENVVDPEILRVKFPQKILDKIGELGYRKIDPSKLTLIGEDQVKDERYTFFEEGSDVIDEAVLHQAMVHLECLDDGCYMLIMSNERHHWHFNIFSKNRRARVIAKIYEDNSPHKERTWGETIKEVNKMAYENVVDQKCFFCEDTISGNQKYMTSGKNLVGARGRIPRWLKAKPEWRWAWNGLGDVINGEHIRFLFYLCPQHQTQEHYNQAFRWAQGQIDQRKIVSPQ